MGTPSVSKFSMGGHNPEQTDNQKPDVQQQSEGQVPALLLNKMDNQH